MPLFEELTKRGIIDAISHEILQDKLNQESMAFYAGFDPTAKSIQIGNLFIVMTMKRMQLAGHRPFILIGGATGMIGDPSGKSAERNLLSEETLNFNIAAQTKQLKSFLDFDCGENSAVIVNNMDWMKGFSYLEFLRDVGKSFRLSDMLSKDSVKSRLNSEVGISYTEFSYQILQAFDFSYLNSQFGVSLQIGGSDQWGNMTAGTDLTRKLHGRPAFCLTVPLVTNAQGQKIGKSDGGETIYLDPEMTSPYKMYQYLLNTDDQSVTKFLNFFSFRSLDEIQELGRVTIEEPHLRLAQKALASDVVAFVHGQAGLQSAEAATSFFFGKKIENVSDQEVASIFQDVPSIEVEKSLLGNITALDLLAQTPLFKSKGEAKRALGQNGVYFNNVALADGEQMIGKNDLASESALVVRKGKKNYCVIRFSL